MTGTICPNTGDMTDCKSKKRCAWGACEGQSLPSDPADYCPLGYTFREDYCDCEGTPSQYWRVEWMYAPISVNVNCTNIPGGGYCGLGPVEGPYFANLLFPNGVNVVYTGFVGSWYRGACGGGYGPGGLDDGTMDSRTGASFINRGSGWEAARNYNPAINSTSRQEWHGFTVATNTGSYVTSPGDLWLLILGPAYGGAVNCNETQYIVTGVYPTDSSGNPL